MARYPKGTRRRDSNPRHLGSKPIRSSLIFNKISKLRCNNCSNYCLKQPIPATVTLHFVTYLLHQSSIIYCNLQVFLLATSQHYFAPVSEITYHKVDIKLNHRDITKAIKKTIGSLCTIA
jgi:hypothetical protein